MDVLDAAVHKEQLVPRGGVRDDDAAHLVLAQHLQQHGETADDLVLQVGELLFVREGLHERVDDPGELRANRGHTADDGGHRGAGHRAPRLEDDAARDGGVEGAHDSGHGRAGLLRCLDRWEPNPELADDGGVQLAAPLLDEVGAGRVGGVKPLLFEGRVRSFVHRRAASGRLGNRGASVSRDGAPQ